MNAKPSVFAKLPDYERRVCLVQLVRLEAEQARTTLRNAIGHVMDDQNAWHDYEAVCEMLGIPDSPEREG